MASRFSEQYRLDALVGEGGMAKVYRAWQFSLERWVAVKVCYWQQDEDRRQFRDEATLLGHLRHPAIVGVHDYFEASDHAYLVMELLEGATLRSVVEKRVPDEPEVRQWLLQILDVMDFLHAQSPPVILRDLKPENLIVEASGRIRLFDFGIAKRLLLGQETQLHLKGMGSEYYAPLEQYGQGSTDERSDYYSLGATLYFLLTGQDPMPAWQRLAKQTPLDPGGSLGPFVRSLTALFPQDRPDDPRSLLQGATSSSPGSQRGGVGKARLLRAEVVERWDVQAWVRPGLWLLAWAMDDLLLADDCLLRLDLGQGKVQQTWGAKLRSKVLAASEDGGKVALLVDQQKVLLWTGGRPRPKELPMDTATRWICLLPKSVISLSGNYRLHAHDLVKGQKLQSFGPQEWWLWLTGRSFSTCVANAQVVGAAASDGALFLWDLAGARPLWQSHLASPITAMDLSVDGHFLLCVARDMQLSLWQVESGTCLGQWQGRAVCQAVYFSHDGRAAVLVAEREFLVWDVANANICLSVQVSAPIEAHAWNRSRLLALRYRDGKVEVFSLALG